MKNARPLNFRFCVWFYFRAGIGYIYPLIPSDSLKSIQNVKQEIKNYDVYQFEPITFVWLHFFLGGGVVFDN